MKYLFFIVLLVAVLITAGCVGGNKETVVTPIPQIVYVTVLVTPTPTSTVVLAQDPILGVWNNGDTWGYTDIVQFKPDGTWHDSCFNSLSMNWHEEWGTWTAQGSNSYILHSTSPSPVRESYTYIYDPAQNGIHLSDIPAQVYQPFKRDVATFKAEIVAAAASAPTSTPTYSSPPSSSGSTRFSGSGDDVKSFTATGSGLRIFTMRHTGTHNFAVVLKDSGGNYVTLLANEIGSYSGKKSERLTSGSYYLDITADGSWTIDISSM
jgi:hypothetical protein